MREQEPIEVSLHFVTDEFTTRSRSYTFSVFSEAMLFIKDVVRAYDDDRPIWLRHEQLNTVSWGIKGSGYGSRVKFENGAVQNFGLSDAYKVW